MDHVQHREDLDAQLSALEAVPGFRLEESLAQVAEVEAAAQELGDLDLVWRARLVRADAWSRQGRLAEAARLIRAGHDYATAQGRRRLRARCHFLLSKTFRDLGDLASYLDHSVQALESLDDDAPVAERALYTIRLGDALYESAPESDWRGRYEQAQALAAEAGDVRRQLIALNNLAYAEYLDGQPERADAAITRLLQVSSAHGRSLTTNTLDTVARIEIALGRHADAERTARAALTTYQRRETEDAADLAAFLLTLAVAQRHLEDHRPAQVSLDAAADLCATHDLASVGVRVQEEQAELLAAQGRYAEAFETHKAFRVAEAALVSAQRDAQARLRQTMFETTEARRQADLFRDQARRDPLTGLYNRRHVNEVLPRLLEDPTHDAGPLVAALLDLDHFKRINDTCSHQTGDEVLAAVADLFRAAVAAATAGPGATGFAARMGGEEFLVVLSGLDPTDAVQHLDALRRRVAEHDWSPLTGAVPVTVSIGTAVAGQGSRDTQSTLLRRADDALYLAKRSGRDTLRSGD